MSKLEVGFTLPGWFSADFNFGFLQSCPLNAIIYLESAVGYTAVNSKECCVGKSTKLRDTVVLGLLNEQPRYGYEIKTIIDNVLAHISDVSSGSLYYDINRLVERGLIEEVLVEKVGRRPQRSIYQLTEAGKAQFSDMLPELLFPFQQVYLPLNLALFFFENLNPRERIRRLAMLQERLKLTSGFIRDTVQEVESFAPRWHILISQHYLRYFRMEMKFVSDMLEALSSDSGYKLTKADLDEVQAEFEDFKTHFNYSSYVQAGQLRD